jgi:ABC-type phosphate transport system substrate-binding protein
MWMRGSLLCWRGWVVLAALLLLPTLSLAARYEVIVNRSLEVDTLSKAELQAFFLGEKVKWNGKKYVKIALLEDPAVLKEFLQSVVGKTPSQFDTHWSKLVFTGKASMPPSFAESAKMIEFVAGKPGAIGFVPAGQAGNSVKVIKVQ